MKWKILGRQFLWRNQPLPGDFKTMTGMLLRVRSCWQACNLRAVTRTRVVGTLLSTCRNTGDDSSFTERRRHNPEPPRDPSRGFSEMIETRESVNFERNYSVLARADSVTCRQLAGLRHHRVKGYNLSNTSLLTASGCMANSSDHTCWKNKCKGVFSGHEAELEHIGNSDTAIR